MAEAGGGGGGAGGGGRGGKDTLPRNGRNPISISFFVTGLLLYLHGDGDDAFASAPLSVATAAAADVADVIFDAVDTEASFVVAAVAAVCCVDLASDSFVVVVVVLLV